jgi:hypothetical protein
MVKLVLCWENVKEYLCILVRKGYSYLHTDKLRMIQLPLKFLLCEVICNQLIKYIHAYIYMHLICSVCIFLTFQKRDIHTHRHNEILLKYFKKYCFLKGSSPDNESHDQFAFLNYSYLPHILQEKQVFWHTTLTYLFVELLNQQLKPFFQVTNMLLWWTSIGSEK